MIKCRKIVLFRSCRFIQFTAKANHIPMEPLNAKRTQLESLIQIKIKLEKQNNHSEVQLIQNRIKSYLVSKPLKISRVTLDSPSELLEKFINQDKVHSIKSLDDLKDRLTNYRRIYMLHHQDINSCSYLAFIQIALSSNISDDISKIIPNVQRDEPESSEKILAANFYSINSNALGFRGINLGSILIQKSVEELQKEFPCLVHFSTLSPLPNFRRWFLQEFSSSQREQYFCDYMTMSQQNITEIRHQIDLIHEKLKSEIMIGQQDLVHTMDFLKYVCFRYLIKSNQNGPIDPVARFHIKNGAQIFRLNPLANSHQYGLESSFGFMANYKYHLKSMDTLSERFDLKKIISISQNLKDFYDSLTTDLRSNIALENYDDY